MTVWIRSEIKVSDPKQKLDERKKGRKDIKRTRSSRSNPRERDINETPPQRRRIMPSSRYSQ